VKNVTITRSKIKHQKRELINLLKAMLQYTCLWINYNTNRVIEKRWMVRRKRVVLFLYGRIMVRASDNIG
jgi:hypothetical protein